MLINQWLDKKKLCAIINGKSLWIDNQSASNSSVELNFDAEYGEIAGYHWHKESEVLVAFHSGHFLSVSTSFIAD
jgi:hypothetical protein